jgi:hypothetical protein
MQPGLPRSPLCLALILAHSIDYDSETGMWSIVGPYSELEAESFPVEYSSMEAYAVLTACDGDVLVELRLVDAKDARPPVFRHLVSVHFDGPRDVQEVIVHHFNVTIPVADEYQLQLFVYGPGMPVQGQGVLVLERRLNMTQAT